MNVAAPRLAAHLDRCWEAYRQGLIAEVAGLLAATAEMIRTAERIDSRSRANAEVELSMLSVIVTMVTGDRPTDCLKVAAKLAEHVADPTAACDGLHRLGGFAAGVHAGMRAAELSTTETRFQQALVVAQGLNAEGGESGVSSDDVCAVIGCAGLHYAGAAAAAGDARTALALLEHSAVTAAQLDREHYLLGQYFGPLHVAALRSICLASLQRYREALEVGRGVAAHRLIPLVHATLLRTMAEASDRLELGSSGAVLRARADAVSPALRHQFSSLPGAEP